MVIDAVGGGQILGPQQVAFTGNELCADMRATLLWHPVLDFYRGEVEHPVITLNSCQKQLARQFGQASNFESNTRFADVER